MEDYFLRDFPLRVFAAGEIHLELTSKIDASVCYFLLFFPPLLSISFFYLESTLPFTFVRIN